MRHTTEARLRRTFADVIGVILATAAGAAMTGCGASTSSSAPGTGGDGGVGGPSPEWTSACVERANIYELTSILGAGDSSIVDGAVRRYEEAFAFMGPATDYQGGVVGGGEPEHGDLWKANDTDKIGALCSKASNTQACLDKVAGYRVLPPTREACAAQYPYANGPKACFVQYILYTRGDEIGVARNPAETTALIGTFDTLGKVLWVAGNANLSLSCAAHPSLKVKESQYRTTEDGGYDLVLTDAQNCAKTTYEVSVHVDRAGKLTELSRKDLNTPASCAVAGRRPEGLCADDSGHGTDVVGAHFAAMATLEAASVIAFRRLHRQLASHGAPQELLERVRTAARDEVRHARATRTLAKKFGAAPRAPRIDALKEEPTLFAIALENAREGCVRETYGALVAHLQIERAGDEDVRACMRAIADEETAHAALAWDVAAWLESQLGDDARALLASERRDAVATLARELAAPVDARLQQASGIPDADEALRMLEELDSLLLAA